MADSVLVFPIGKGAPFQKAVDDHLDQNYPHFTEEERAEIKSRLVAAVDKHKVPYVELKFPADAFPSPEHETMVKRTIESQIVPYYQSLLGNLFTDVFFLHCYSFSLEVELNKKST